MDIHILSDTISTAPDTPTNEELLALTQRPREWLRQVACHRSTTGNPFGTPHDQQSFIIASCLSCPVTEECWQDALRYPHPLGGSSGVRGGRRSTVVNAAIGKMWGNRRRSICENCFKRFIATRYNEKYCTVFCSKQARNSDWYRKSGRCAS